MQKLKTLKELVVGWDELFEGLIFGSVDVAIEDNCDVFGSYFLEELFFLLDHEGSGYNY